MSKRLVEKIMLGFCRLIEKKGRCGKIREINFYLILILLNSITISRKSYTKKMMITLQIFKYEFSNVCILFMCLFIILIIYDTVYLSHHYRISLFICVFLY